MGAKRHSKESMTVEPPSLSGSLSGYSSVLVAAVLAAFVVVWAATNLLLGGDGFAVLVSDKAVGGEEAASALARLFAALVLGLFLADAVGWRARWIAGGLVVLGLGHLVFGYIEPLIQEDPPELNESLYEAFVTQTLACALFVVGVFPGRPPRLLVWAATAIPAALVVGYVVLFEFLHGEEWMPPLSLVANPERTVMLGSPLVWLTLWHWALSALPLGLATAALVGAFWQGRRGLLRGWLLIAVVLLAGSVLHDYLWPSAYGGSLLTTADALSLTFAVVVAVGGISELRRVASERTRLLASERERTRRLNELNALRSDFSAMIAHELETPIAAVRKLNEMLSAQGDDPGVREYATAATEGELDALTKLVRDVRAVAAVERDDFKVKTRPLPLEKLLTDGEMYASTLPWHHPVEVTILGGLSAGVCVLADPERIGQVLRNLLSNAARYSPEGTPIALRLIGKEGRVRLEVADRGRGIHPDDVTRIFEKFGWGRGRESQKMPGVGLGLYLSRRIVRSHGSELTVQTRVGEGSVFGFELEVVL
ncbi:MAG TPA: HAMP domain-containing sensor histidine kinase [Rubrobacter sp.]|nr:HAMP domain-containing sensor histidine kinase [Rubrobacter sp.]